MRKVFITFSFFIATAGISLALAGCGGGGGDTTVTASSRTKAEFIKLANGICDRERQDLIAGLGAYVQSHENDGKPQNEVVTDAIRVAVLPKLQTQIDEIRALGAPKGDELKIEEFLSALQEAVDAGNQFVVKDFARSSKLAQEYGIESCAYAGT